VWKVIIFFSLSKRNKKNLEERLRMERRQNMAEKRKSRSGRKKK